MLRVSLGIHCRSLLVPRSSQFTFSVIQRNVKSIISEIPEENLNGDISSNKEFAKIVNTKNCDGRNIVYGACYHHAFQERPLTSFSLEQVEAFKPSFIPEVPEDYQQQDVTGPDFQDFGSSSACGDFEGTSTLLEMFGENEEIESLNKLDQGKTVPSLSVTSENSSEMGKMAGSNPASPVEGTKHGFVSQKKKKKVKQEKLDGENPSTGKEYLGTISQKKTKKKGKQKLTDNQTSEKTGVLSIDISETKVKKKKKTIKDACSKQSEVQSKESATVALNKRHMQTLKSYVSVCVSTNMLAKAHKAVFMYRSKNSPKFAITDVEIYDALLAGWAQKGELTVVKYLFKCMRSDGLPPTLQSYASYLECLSRNNMHHDPAVKWVLTSLEQDGYHLEDLFVKCKFTGDQVGKLIEIINSVKPDATALLKARVSSEYSCRLLSKLNDKSGQTIQTQNSFLSREVLGELAISQMETESKCTVEIKSVVATENVSEKVRLRREQVKKCEDTWRGNLSLELKKALHLYQNKLRIEKRFVSLYPFLTSVDPKILIDIMLKEARFLAGNCENFSPSVNILYHNIGKQVMNHYFVSLKKNNKINDKILNIYNKYCEHLVSPQLSSKYSPREFWEHLKVQELKGPTIDASDVSWSFSILNEVGRFLYKVIFAGTGFDVNLSRGKSSKEYLMPTFYNVPVNVGLSLTHQIRVHPRVSQMYHEAELEDMCFDVSMLPMLCPPRPWSRIHAGGLLLTHLPFIRLPCIATQTNLVFDKVPSQQLLPCFDSLNKLSLCPWIINKPILDLVIGVFRNNGSEELEIPVNPKSVSFHCEIKKSPHKRSGLLREQFKKKAEMTSLWQDCLYKLTIANSFRDKVFWFPHNLDFRGRVYPTPPHFNHLGSDMVRSILLFAEGKPLGENGLNWLKIHLINLTGLKKREPLSERLKFANIMMPEILDSADKPFTGNQWWKSSDEPWQTLACCKEIAKAVRSPDPSKFVSHFPVHQDGSCNGLQHYAALGRDEFGAQEVNLHPSDTPHDVYSSVAALVEKERSIDAANGSEIARALERFIIRKVVKQTVMTYVYGVTPFGAKLQILKQLKDIPEFPENHHKDAIKYLSAKIFLSIEKMFTATQHIQNWLTDCAEVITKILGKPVEWVTPVGLPVVQPYHREVSIKGPSNLSLSKDSPVSYRSTFEASQRPNVMKQKNAFAPNFIHSLDSSHMMLTSLFCHHEGITFVSVHDCFWTHACTVEIMNRVCREQFVALHSEPILEQLSEYFVKCYLHDGETDVNEKPDEKQLNITSILTNVPGRGNFKLEKVLDSVYFFS